MFKIGELAEQAGVTVRTLHHYDRIGLLKPSRHSPAGYRLYGEQDALRLQQILLYREMDLSLEAIKVLLDTPDFDPLKALSGHRQELNGRIIRLQRLKRTVENTIAYLQGETTMEKAKIFSGFTPEEEEYYTAEAEKQYDPAIVRESSRKWKAYGSDKQKKILEEGKTIYLDIVAAMPLGPESTEVQRLVGLWREHMSYFWTPAVDQLIPLAENYAADFRFKKNFDAIHPGLAEFMGEAVRIYVRNLK
jgi:DNA-binding transcriptional MerR regulator